LMSKRIATSQRDRITKGTKSPKIFLGGLRALRG
jgi:hypothetical protein